MAEIFVSPGVYVRERDFSYYVSSIGDSALALIGETKKGPAMRPTLITNMAEFREIFGDLDPNKQVGYCAKAYFKYSNKAYITRVLGADDLRGSNNIITIQGSGATEPILATLLCTGTPEVKLLSGVTEFAAADENFFLEIENVYSGNVNLVDTTSPVYIETLFPRTNTVNATTVALQHVFGIEAASYEVSSGAGTSTGVTSIIAGGPLVVDGYSNAHSPLIVGDIADGSTEASGLFTFYTVSDGNQANQDVKVSIENIDSANTTFDVVVRQFSDTNAAQVLLERFPKLKLDPTDRNYISRAIGDSRDETGNYALISKYIYVEVEPDAPVSGMPYGFNRIVCPMSGDATFPEFRMTTAYVGTTSIKRQILGVNFDSIDSDMLMGGWSSAWNLSATSDNYIKGFHLNSGASATYYQVGPELKINYTKTNGKFTFPLLGGNDGWVNSGTARNLLFTVPTATEETQWEAALDTVRSTEEIDINLLAVPGVAIDTSIGNYAIELVEERADAFYIGDMPSGSPSATQAATVTASIDSNYAATYWPYVKTYDNDNMMDVTLPATPQALEAIAYTDQVAYPWFAPAGMNRGLLTDVVRAEFKVSQDDREELYENKINPIATFPGQGIVIWGQKTLQTRTTALDRINVRRMLLYVEKVIAGASLYLDFEQNDETTWDQFKAIVQPVLDIVKIKRGLVDFRVIMDETTNTPDMQERGQMVGQIYIKPTKTAEVILINFNLLAQGATFEE